MARLEVISGDFVKGVGVFHRGNGFMLWEAPGKVAILPLCRLELVDHASDSSLQLLSATDEMRADFQGAIEAEGQRIFIAKFADGRILLAEADQKSFEEICTAWEKRNHDKEGSRSR